MFFYQLISIILAPLIDIYLIIRKSSGKEDKSRFYERLGYPSLKRPEGKLIWIHCASVGESNSILPLVDYLLKKHSKIHILLTSGTVTSAKILGEKLPKRAFHQFIPIDKLFTVKRFLKYWQPNLAIFVESEIWPNLIHQTSKSGCKLALLNARISKKSYLIWLILHKIGFNILKHFNTIFAQSIQDQIRFKNLGLIHVNFAGNLKSVQTSPKIKQSDLNKLKKATKDRKIWIAASTHKGEEEIIIRTHKQLKEFYPDILTIIIPRHPKRLNLITQLIYPTLNYKIRSKKEGITPETDLYIADTLGELALFYKLSDIAFIGGSLVKNIGGHNPYEAIKSDCIPISGPYTDNFKETYQKLGDDKSSIIVQNQKELLFSLSHLLKNPKLMDTTIKSNKNLDKETDKILEKIYKGLDKYF